MADTKTTATKATEAKFEIDTKEISRVLAVIRYRISESVRDANRRRPFLSDSQDEARAKAIAQFKVLKEFSEQNL